MDHRKVTSAFQLLKRELGCFLNRVEQKDADRIQKLVTDPKWEQKTQNMANKILDIGKAMRRAEAAYQNPTLCLEDRVKMINIFVQRVLELEIQGSVVIAPVKIANIKKLQKEMLNG